MDAIRHKYRRARGDLRHIVPVREHVRYFRGEQNAQYEGETADGVKQIKKPISAGTWRPRAQKIDDRQAHFQVKIRLDRVPFVHRFFFFSQFEKVSRIYFVRKKCVQ